MGDHHSLLLVEDLSLLLNFIKIQEVIFQPQIHHASLLYSNRRARNNWQLLEIVNLEWDLETLGIHTDQG